MIFFFSDNHYNTHAGRNIFQNFPEDLKKRTAFFEDDFSVLEDGSWEKKCTLLVLHLIGGTCSLPHPGAGAEKAVKNYCEQGGNMLLLHGSSAAFWQWQWWRSITGLRWARPNDPDQVDRSTHPQGICSVKVCKCRHELSERLIPFELPEDEVYTSLEQTRPAMFLMEGWVNGENSPQCSESHTPWGGKVINFIPGHKEICVNTPELSANIEILLRYLLKDVPQIL